MEDQLKGMAYQPRRDGVSLKVENKQQKTKLEGSQQEQINERERQLKTEEDQVKRREIQLETILRLEDEINTQTRMIEHLTKIKQEREEEMKKYEERMKDQALQIERNNETLKTQEEKLQMLNVEVQHMKKETQRAEQQIHREKQWIEEENKALKNQWTEIEENKEKIQRQESVNKEKIDQQELEKLGNEEKIKTQTTLLFHLNEEIKYKTAVLDKLKKETETQTALKLKMEAKRKECEGILQRQKNTEQINEREIKRQTTQLQEHNTTINTQKEEIDRQQKEIQNNARILRETRREKKTLEKSIQTIEKQQKMENEKFQKQVNEFEKQKKLHEQNLSLMRLAAYQNKYKEVRRRENELQIMQDKYDQLDNRLSSSSYMQDCDTEWDLREELGKIIDQMKMELQKSSEELEVQKKTQEQTERRKEQESNKNDEQDDATWDAAGTGGDIMKQHKVSEEEHPQKSFFKNTPHSDIQGIIRRSTLKSPLELMQHLNLENFYPNKLTTESVLSVGSPKKKKSKSNVAFSYLEKLLMLNYRVRFVIEENENQNCTLSTKTRGKWNSGILDEVSDASRNYGATCKAFAKGIPQSVSEKKIFYQNDPLDEFLSEKNDSNNSQENEKIHPMDVQMAVFHCTDSFLRQYMVTKLSYCQYALPLLVPSPTSTDIDLPLWTFQQIKKTWKPAGAPSISLPVCQIKAPMVFFCRLGSVSTSKSQLLNSVINPKHDTFFHRNSPGSSRSRQFMEGLVEIAWYCPAGNTDDLFNEFIAFCNLHGDAVDHKKQTAFFTEQATVNIILMENVKPRDKDRKLLEKLYSSSKPFICVISDVQKGPLKIMPGLNVKIGLNGRNSNELNNDVTDAIKTCLQKCNFSPTFSLEESLALAKCFGFRVDEDLVDYQEGKTEALEIMKLLEGEDISQIKNKFLPCQGKLWHEWARKNKELHRLCGKMERTNSTLAEMDKIRKTQRMSNLTFMKSFVKNLQSNRKTQTQEFVQWIRYFIDNKFSYQVSQVHQKYNSKWLEVQKLKNTQGKSEELKDLLKQLEEVSEELDMVTLGLEHIFREMGQIYEAWATVPDEMGVDISAYPAVVADLLIYGHPLELMDGDAAHVPLIWIKSVLDKVTERLGDQRVFVLSVLGLQSSGKSTMLNALFGLQFAVSAGRCTRGAFMQLIRVKDEDKEELKFDYLLVVDTEGLQSLELSGKSTFSHDNELATFVIGLANMTLINIFGENPAEIQDILLIVIQAILRMNKLHLNPRCMFVHQNISDIKALEKNMEGKIHLQEKLDQITVSVGKTEGRDVKCFSDVIKFNIQTDVHYFAQLWEGNPPMAPPNPRYSENAESLKQAILEAAVQQKALRFSELKVRIEDLWTAVLNEDFMFSFRSSLDMAFYWKQSAL